MRELRNYRDRDSMCVEAAEYLGGCILESLKTKDYFYLVLSGGLLLNALYKTLFYLDNIPWEKIHFFISDERCLPPENDESNFHNAVQSLLRKTKIPLQNIHWINTDIQPLKKAAQDYEKTLKYYLARNSDQFDLIILSLGPDGHIASLFPGFSAVLEKKKLVVLTEKSLLDPRVPRITMTLPAINKARSIMFFISDENCRTVLNEIIFRKEDDKFCYPAELIYTAQNRQIWFILRT